MRCDFIPKLDSPVKVFLVHVLQRPKLQEELITVLGTMVEPLRAQWSRFGTRNSKRRKEIETHWQHKGAIAMKVVKEPIRNRCLW